MKVGFSKRYCKFVCFNHIYEFSKPYELKLCMLYPEVSENNAEEE